MMNAIERVIERKIPNLKRSDELVGNRKRLMNEHKLDTLIDPALPSWAVRLLADSGIGASVKIEMVLTHHFDITGEVASERYVCPKELPKVRKPTKIEIDKFKSQQAKIAERYIRSRRKGK